MSLLELRRELKNVRKESCPMPVSRMSKVAIATELERHKHTKMPGMKDAITDKVVEVMKAPVKTKAVKAVKAVKEVPITQAKQMPSKMIKKAVAPVVAPAVPSKLVKGSQEARDRMNAVRAMKKKTA